MWYAWNMDNIIMNETEDKIAFKTKSEILWQESCNACDGRKRLTVTKNNKGYYTYFPRNCDGEWNDSITIVNEKYLNNNQNIKNTFLEFLNRLNEENEKDIECVKIYNKTEKNDYFKSLIMLRQEIEDLKKHFNSNEDV